MTPATGGDISGRGTRLAAAGLLLAVQVVAGSLASVTGARAEDRLPACRVVAPQTWQGAEIQWIGRCNSGLAEGLGVAIARFNGQPQERFFGSVAAGKVVEGVIELPGGYRPMRFKGDAPLPLDERNQIIAVFRVASAAAQAARDRRRAAGDMPAAREFDDAAERLANQMD
ncbi:MAG: hypothetical protein KIT36_05180 [Alphaproteobacteria bacterium]|nr:hypothetical protein [Alphaproteobacteria bacterium]